MKELELSSPITVRTQRNTEPVRLTVPGKKPYAENGVIFMPEPTTEAQVNTQPLSQEVQVPLRPSIPRENGQTGQIAENGKKDSLIAQIQDIRRSNARARELAQRFAIEQIEDGQEQTSDSPKPTNMTEALAPWEEVYRRHENPEEREALLEIARDLKENPIEDRTVEEIERGFSRVKALMPGMDSLNKDNVRLQLRAEPLANVYIDALEKRGGGYSVANVDGQAPREKPGADSENNDKVIGQNSETFQNAPSSSDMAEQVESSNAQSGQQESEGLKRSEASDPKQAEASKKRVVAFQLNPEDIQRLEQAAKNLPDQSEAIRRLATRVSEMSESERLATQDELLKRVEAISNQLGVNDIPGTAFPDLPDLPPVDATPEERNVIERERQRLLSEYTSKRQAFMEQRDLSNIHVEMGELSGVLSKVVRGIRGQTEADIERIELKWEIDIESDRPITDDMSREEVRRAEHENALRENYLRPIRRAHNKIDDLLNTPPPDLKSQLDAQYTLIEVTIDKLDLADHTGTTATVLEFISEESLAHDQVVKIEADGTRIKAPDRRGKEHYGFAVEYALEKVIGRGDENATAEYPSNPGFYVNNNIDSLMESTRNQDRDVAIYLTNLRGKRVLAHELFRNLKDRKTFVEYVTRALDTGGLQFIEDQVGGVSDVQALYEKELARMTGLKGYRGEGWLLFEDYFNNPKNLEKDSIDRNVQNLVESDLFTLARETSFAGRRTMRSWEKSRAFFMGRAVTAGSQRRLIYSIFGDKPQTASGADFIISLEAEPITSILAPLKFDAVRWKGQAIAKRYIQRLFENKRKRATDNGLRYGIEGMVNGRKKEFGLYGASVDATVSIDTGIHDPKSSWWRINKIFLDQPEYKHQTPQGMLTVSDYFDALSDRFGKEYDSHHSEEERANVRYDHHKFGKVKDRMNENLAGFLSEQRLFLGALMQRGDLKPESKEILWKKTSKLLPSRIAALMPQFAMEEVKGVVGKIRGESQEAYETRVQGKWDSVMRKLFIVEQDRVREDARGLKMKADGSGMEDPSVGSRELIYYINRYNARPEIAADESLKLSPDDKRIIQRWQDLGIKKSGQLARVNSNTALFLDDVPRTAWNLMGRTDLDRILVGDQSGFAEAYTGMIGVAANPAQKAEKILEPAHGFVNTVQNILDLEAAQGYVEPFLASYTQMAKIKPKGDWLPFNKLFRVASSEFEEYNMQAGVTFDAMDTGEFYAAAAQQETIADDPGETTRITRFKALDKVVERPLFKAVNEKLPKLGPINLKNFFYKDATQYQRLLKEEGGDWNKKVRRQMRMFLLIFGAILPLEILKAIVPDEVSKNV